MGKNLKKYKEKYVQFKHHGWAGLGFLSLLLAVRYFISIPKYILIPAVSALIVYVLAALILTYKYREGLASSAITSYNNSKEEAKARKKAAKEKAKLEKKRLKNKLKIEKKKAKNKLKKEKKNNQ